MRLAGKTALVTAAGRGAGRASALALAAEGAQVWATDADADGRLLAGYQGIERVRAATLDPLDRAALGRLAAGLPQIDILFNGTAFVRGGGASQSCDEEWNRALDFNVRSPFWAIQAALPHMLAAGGSIINMAGVRSSIHGLPNRFIHGVTQAAVIGLTKSIAADYMADGIRCNAICPRTADTDIAALVVFLASDQSAFITGQAYAADALPHEYINHQGKQ